MNRLPAQCAAVLALLGVLSGCGDGKQPAANAPQAQPAAATAAPAEPHPLPGVAHAAVDMTGLQKAEGGQTIAELYANKDALAGKPIKVRGRVVKANANIMDRTWVHLRDGTGEEGRNDLTITTKDAPPPIGATVLLTGTLTTNKDLGAGYSYEVIVEDGTLVAE